MLEKRSYTSFADVATSIIHSIIEISEDIYVLLIQDNLNTNILKELNIKLNSEYKSYPSAATVNSNVAIASAVTAYARIHMSQFKNNPQLPNLYYTDTDSVHFDGPIPDGFISSEELG
jgi:hypothetical protein